SQRDRVKGDVVATSTVERNRADDGGSLSRHCFISQLCLRTAVCSRGAKTIRVRQSSFFFFDVASVLPSELPNSTDRTCMLLDKKTNKIRKVSDPCKQIEQQLSSLDTSSPDQSLETLQTLKPCKEHCPTKLVTNLTNSLATWSSSSPLRQLQDISTDMSLLLYIQRRNHAE
ncbi:hypothetical protein IGI04_027795, partial [Brassica rapa subsp. trilocularis]